MADAPADLAGTRVLLVLATSTGGVGEHVRSLADELARRGVTVTVACPASTQRAFGFARHQPVQIGTAPSLSDLRAVRVLRALARRHDVVHAHGLRAGAVVPRGSVVTWHNAQLSGSRLGAVLERWVALRAAVTLAASQDLADRASSLGAGDVRFAPVAAPVRVPSGADPGLGHPLVLAVGRLHPQKGYDVLLRAVPLLGDAVVAVAGDGPLRSSLESQAPTVRWLGHRDDVADLLAAADVVVLPSVWEARSLTAQEAMRAGRPLVATAVGGLPDLVRDGAVLVAPGDADALGAAVRALLDDPVAAAALGERARAVAATWPDLSGSVDTVVEAYRTVLP